jgi:basic membrane protein A
MSHMKHLTSAARWARGAITCLVVAVSVAALVACGDSESSGGGGSGTSSAGSSDPLSIAVLHGAVIKDGGYAEALLRATNTAIDKLGRENFTVRTVERVPYTAQMTTTTEQLLQQGTDLVIDIASGGPLVYDACRRFPEQHCLEIYPVGTPPPNTAGFWVDLAPYYYVEGVAAGKLTRSGTVGFVGAVRNNLGVAVENSFTLGCQSVRPDCRVRVVYINSFFDPPRAVEAANTLMDGGADVLGHYMNDPSVLKTAAQRGRWAFGFYADQRSVAPETYITSAVYEDSAASSIEQALTALMDGRPLPRGVLYGSPEPIDFPIAPWGENVPDDVRAAAEEAYEKISSGESPYVGPITDAGGRVQTPEGETLDPRSEFVYSGWSWPVQGLVGG